MTAPLTPALPCRQISERDDPPAKRRRLLEAAGGGDGDGPGEGDLVAAVARKELTEATLRSKLETHIEQSDQDHGASSRHPRPRHDRGGLTPRIAAAALEFAMAAGRAADGGTRCGFAALRPRVERVADWAWYRARAAATCSSRPSAHDTRSEHRCAARLRRCGCWCERAAISREMHTRQTAQRGVAAASARDGCAAPATAPRHSAPRGVARVRAGGAHLALANAPRSVERAPCFWAPHAARSPG